jgi:acetyl esterase/lipase
MKFFICLTIMTTFLLTLNAKEAKYKSNVPERTHTNVSYGKYTRQVLDFWQASSDKPTPLVVVIHGGAWMKGSKEQLIQRLDIKPLLKAGISVASINYRLIKGNKEEDSDPAVKHPLNDAARAIQFLRSKAKEWNLEKKKFAAVGQSAGGCSSLWLLYHDDMAKPKSEDPIERESTRLYCAAVSLAQTSIDPKQIIE